MTVGMLQQKGFKKKKSKLHSEPHKLGSKSQKPISKLVAQKPLKKFLEILIKMSNPLASDLTLKPSQNFQI